MEEEFEDLIKQIRNYNINADLGSLNKAWEFAKLAHRNQRRLNGDLTILHGLLVAKRLASWKLDLTTIIAGLLHDSVEYGAASYQDLIKEFGPEVVFLIRALTLIPNRKNISDKSEIFIENIRKMFLAMAKDLRVVFIKLASRVHNMETLYALPQNDQVRIAKDTLEIFAPLAERLGMGEVKGELEDLAFPYVYPQDYKKIVEISKTYYQKAGEIITKMIRSLMFELAKENLRAKVVGRKKHFYSLWKKLQRPEIEGDFEKIHDIVALRILVDDIPECYTALGVVHSLYKPVPNIGISDFIAQPKPNGYRSIHTKVFGPNGHLVEIQIRTYQMHSEAELGIAAHWQMSALKSKGRLNSEDIDQGKWKTPDKLSWVKELVNWQKEITDSQEYLNAVKFDALSHRNFVFSPKGDVYDLPTGATPVDFAYAVHTNLGSYIKQAMVNGKIVPLNFKLKNGDIVEIIKSKNPTRPNNDWLEFVITNTAKREIKRANL